MTSRRLALVVLAIAVLLLAAWGVMRLVEGLIAPPQPATSRAETVQAPSQAPVGHITATLYYGSADGQALVPVTREVPLAEGMAGQGRQILLAQLAPAPAGLVATIPPGTTLRAFYVGARGEAFVDLSNEASAAHPGGSTSELLTVYTIVNAVTTNLPAITRVQILVNGAEVDALAGHVDLRRPLERNTSLVRRDAKTQ